MRSLAIHRWVALLLCGSLAACAVVPPQGESEPDRAEAGSSDAAIARSAWASASTDGPWEHFTVPGKQPTRFSPTAIDGRPTMAADANSSASLLRQHVHVEPKDLGSIRFSWKVKALIEGADMSRRDRDDSPVRIVLAFDGDRSRLSPRDAMLSELSRAVTGEEMPYATLMYVWCNRTPVGGVIRNPRTDRIRKLVLQSGPGALDQWQEHERDIRTDYERVFGEPPGTLIGVAIMTDSDNTRSRARAWYGPVKLRSHARAAVPAEPRAGAR